LIRFPMIGICKCGAADAKGIDQLTSLACTVDEVLLQIQHKT